MHLSGSVKNQGKKSMGMNTRFLSVLQRVAICAGSAIQSGCLLCAALSTGPHNTVCLGQQGPLKSTVRCDLFLQVFVFYCNYVYIFENPSLGCARPIHRGSKFSEGKKWDPGKLDHI